ncbi:MAG TPA: hypothetical protein ENI33_06890 [Thermoplasmatales archaeon]|nr:hypothetical protein [Thermoplasmatales archaeon]
MWLFSIFFIPFFISSEGILSGEEFSEEKIEEVAKILKGEAITEEEEIDKKIDKKIRKIEERMKK